MNDLSYSNRVTQELGNRFPALLYLSPQPISLSEFESGSYIEVNQAWLDFFGYTREEVIGKSRSDLSIWVSAADRAHLRGLLQSGKPVRNASLQCRKKSGEIADVLFTCDPVVLDGGLCMHAAINDVTALKRAERLLRSSEERFGKIFEAVPLGITIVRVADSRFLEVNRACEQLFGYTRAEMIGATSLGLGLWVDRVDRAALTEGLALGETRAADARVRRKCGAVFDAHCTITSSLLAGDPVLLTTWMDITDRKRAERLLRASEERFAKIIEASPQPITITRMSDSTFLHVNQAACNRYGYSRGDLIGRTADQVGIWIDLLLLRTIVCSMVGLVFLQRIPVPPFSMVTFLIPA